MCYSALAISLHPAVWVFHLWVPSIDAVSESGESLRAGVPSWKKGRAGAPIQDQLPLWKQSGHWEVGARHYRLYAL